MVSRGLRIISLSLIVALVAAVLFSISLDTSFEDLRDQYTNDESEFLNLPSGNQAHIRDEGNPAGTPIILLHGSNSSLHTWELWVAELAGEYRLISIDLPGHGLTGRVVGDNYSRFSMVSFVLEVADTLGLEEFSIAGNSMGGGVAWALARRYPDRVSHLVLLAPTGIGRVPQDPPFAFRVGRNPATRPLLRWLAPRWIFSSGLYSSFEDDNFVSEQLIDRYWRLNRLGGNRHASMSRFALDPAPDLKEMQGAIDVPTLILWGEEDQVLPYDQERVRWDLRTKFAGGVEENQIVTFVGAGHLPHIERARETAAFADNFLGR